MVFQVVSSMLLAASLLCSGLSIATTAWIKSNGRQEGLWADCVSPTGDILSYECSANQPRGQYQPSIHRGRGHVPPPGSLSMYTCSPREPIFFWKFRHHYWVLFKSQRNSVHISVRSLSCIWKLVDGVNFKDKTNRLVYIAIKAIIDF